MGDVAFARRDVAQGNRAVGLQAGDDGSGQTPGMVIRHHNSPTSHHRHAGLGHAGFQGAFKQAHAIITGDTILTRHRPCCVATAEELGTDAVLVLAE